MANLVGRPSVAPDSSIVVHELKTTRPFFTEVYHGEKTADLRRHDRPFRVGDHIRMREYLDDCLHYTGSEVIVRITHIVTDRDGPWLADNMCMLSFKIVDLMP